MTHFLRDILRQPKELRRTIDFLLGTGGPALEAARNAILTAGHVFLTGIGSSWHAALTGEDAVPGSIRDRYTELGNPISLQSLR
jgi:fructoselysine-6-P-deglycase FrlB-like protein